MSIVGAKSLGEFEEKRKALSYIPQQREDIQTGDGMITLDPIRTLPGNYRWDLIIQTRTVPIGVGKTFVINGESNSTNIPYRDLVVDRLATLVVDGDLYVTGDGGISTASSLFVNGRLRLDNGGKLHIANHGIVMIPVGGSLTINEGSSINFQSNGTLKVEGTIIIPPDRLDEFYNNPNIIIDPLAIVRINEIPNFRLYSMTDYIADIKQRWNYEVEMTESRMVTMTAKTRFECMASDSNDPSWVLDLIQENGVAIMGDFALRLLGYPSTAIKPGWQSIGHMIIEEGATLHVSEDFRNDEYYHPRIVISNTTDGQAGSLTINGTMIVDTPAPGLVYGNGGTIGIGKTGTLILKDGSRLHNQDGWGRLVINGTIIIDDINQLGGPLPQSIEFGEYGKIIINNYSPENPDERTLLFSTPRGIKSSELYRLFSKRLRHIEYHIPENCGIRLDEYFHNFYLFEDWYGGMRLEKAIFDKCLVWHDGAYVEIDKEIVPWIEATPGLSQIGNLFKSVYPTDQEKLQDLVNRLQYAGSGNMTFRIIDDDVIVETTIHLESCNMESGTYNPREDKYKVTTDGEGSIFLRSSISDTSPDNIVRVDSKEVLVPETRQTTFELP